MESFSKAGKLDSHLVKLNHTFFRISLKAIKMVGALMFEVNWTCPDKKKRLINIDGATEFSPI